MNILREINRSTKLIQFRSLSSLSSSSSLPSSSLPSSSSGNVDLITDIFLTPGRQSIKNLNKLDKGNAKQLIDKKLIFKHGSGYYSLMPFLYKSYAKLVKAIESHMNSIGGQRVLMPSLYYIDLLKDSNRYDDLKRELFTLKTRNNKEVYLAPTHEEPITSIVASEYLSHKQVPLLLYQIDSKFRNELRPRFGLLRANQFIMKDLYSFDNDQESALRTYEKVCQSYVDLFNYLGLDFIKVQASNGLMGGQFSHEFHLISKYGEDDIYLCDDCDKAFNKEMLDNSNDNNPNDNNPNNKTDFNCPECDRKMKHRNSIEIGHTFYLGTKYSEKLNSIIIENKQDEIKKSYSEMCCFGIGVTRILSAFISQQSSLEIDWPLRLAPYQVLIIPPKKGSKENVDEIGSKMSFNIANALKSKGFDVLIDNRKELTIGRRQIDSLAYGFPFRIIIGKESVEERPKFELHHKDQRTSLTHLELMEKFEEISKNL